jgi:predicted dehydrogenase
VLPEEQAEVAAIFPNAKYYETAAELLANEQPDGVVVTLPHSLHLPKILEALEHGAAVFTDKPAGVSADEIRQIVAAEKKFGKRVVVGAQRRALPGYTEIKKQLSQNKAQPKWVVGTFHFSSYPGWQKTWRNNPQLSGSPHAKQGLLLDTGYHLIDSILYILNFPKPTQVFAQANYRDYQVESDVVVTIQFEHDLTVQLTVSRDVPPQYETEGIALLTDQSYLAFNKTSLNGISQSTLTSSRGTSPAQILHFPNTAIAHYPMKAFLQYCADSQFDETWSVNSSLLTLEIIDAAYQSILTKQVVKL